MKKYKYEDTSTIYINGIEKENRLTTTKEDCKSIFEQIKQGKEFVVTDNLCICTKNIHLIIFQPIAIDYE